MSDRRFLILQGLRRISEEFKALADNFEEMYVEKDTSTSHEIKSVPLIDTPNSEISPPREQTTKQRRAEDMIGECWFLTSGEIVKLTSISLLNTKNFLFRAKILKDNHNDLMNNLYIDVMPERLNRVATDEEIKGL